MKTIPLPMLGSKPSTVTIIRPGRAPKGALSWNREWIVKGPRDVLLVVGTSPYFKVMQATVVRRNGVAVGYAPSTELTRFKTLKAAIDFATEKVR